MSNIMYSAVLGRSQVSPHISRKPCNPQSIRLGFYIYLLYSSHLKYCTSICEHVAPRYLNQGAALFPPVQNHFGAILPSTMEADMPYIPVPACHAPAPDVCVTRRADPTSTR